MTTEPKSSPFHFDVYQCPKCDNCITVGVHDLTRPDKSCQDCGKVKVSEYELRKAKGSA